MKLNAKYQLENFEKNIGEMLSDRVERFGEQTVIHEKKDNDYVRITWNQLFSLIKKIGLGLISIGVKKGDKIAVLSRDCYEVLALELACMSIGCIYIPFFQGYYPKQIEYMISHADPKIMIISDEKQLQKVLSTMATGSIEKYFLIDFVEKYFESTRIFDFQLLFKETGDYSLFDKRIREIEPDDECLLIYTSGGATGISKGVPLTHKNILSQQKALQQLWQLDHNDKILSYFEWHQTLGILEKFLALYSGGCLAIDRTPGLHFHSLPETLKEYSPSVYFGPARIFNELVNEMKKNEELDKAFFHAGVKFAFSSTSPTNEVFHYFKAKNVPLLQGWGMTETLHLATTKVLEGWINANNSGYPIPGVEVMIADEDDEIYLKGVHVMKNYYKDDEKTKSYFTEDGFFKTGDAGEITENGLKILGRTDSRFNLTDGTKIYANTLEHLVESASLFISHCVLVGENLPFTCALIFPDIQYLRSWYNSRNGYLVPLTDALEEEEVINLYRNEIARINQSELFSEAAIKYIILIDKELTVKRGELTSAMTVIRKQVFENYKDFIEMFYNKELFDAPGSMIVRINDK